MKTLFVQYYLWDTKYSFTNSYKQNASSISKCKFFYLIKKCKKNVGSNKSDALISLYNKTVGFE